MKNDSITITWELPKEDISDKDLFNFLCELKAYYKKLHKQGHQYVSILCALFQCQCIVRRNFRKEDRERMFRYLKALHEQPDDNPHWTKWQHQKREISH